eukprot:CAMPEP_0198215834 /NCGR_PEP_ID=MMETSP1445-20131203/53033_1 /TAXON_ID=36898 /ORGANISM="Pyramimonas sp., Strain CCMP2087" /LENGTH=243 /DNA_ID=CAMNT_0043891761 /DNA_START=133 /DNA_END=861 /DNA_ORIENTATION=+
MGDSEGEVPCSGLECLSRVVGIRKARVQELLKSDRKIDLCELRQLSDTPQRGDLNLRFAANTFINTSQANKHKDESRMWRARSLEVKLGEMQAVRHSVATPNDLLDPERKRCRDTKGDLELGASEGEGAEAKLESSSSRKAEGADASNSGADVEKAWDLKDFLASKTKRGRGEVGSFLDREGREQPEEVGVSSERGDDSTSVSSGDTRSKKHKSKKSKQEKKEKKKRKKKSDKKRDEKVCKTR